MKKIKLFWCKLKVHNWLITYTVKGALFHSVHNKVYQQNFLCLNCGLEKSKTITKK